MDGVPGVIRAWAGAGGPEPMRAGAFAAPVLRLVPPLTFLAVLLVVRGVADAVTDVALGETIRLNLASLLGLAAIAYAALLASATPRIVGRGVTIAVIAAIGVWVLVGFAVHGYQASIVREATRIVAVVAVGFIAANARNATPLRL
ncbi:MAG: hypothetical protein ACRDHD_08990, partial [Candidatus Limnocylindria bacterium]